VVFVDALGEREAPLLAERLPGLARHAVQGILGYSSGALPTILTGRSPEAHGRMCLFSRWQGPGASPLSPLSLLGLIPTAVRHRPRVQALVARIWLASRGYDGYFTPARVPPALYRLLDAPEDRDLFHAPHIGGHVTFLEEARRAGLRVAVSDFRQPEATRAGAIERSPDADLAFLYLAGLDATLHRTGSVGHEAIAWADFAARAVERSRAALGRGGRQVTTIVIGDHGMSEVTRVIDPRAATRQIEALPGRPTAFVDATMLRVWAGPSALERARKILEDLGATPLDAAALADRRAPSDGSYGDLVGLLPEGSIFAPSFLGGAVRGMHGYDRASRSARAALLGDAPGLDAARDLEDVAALVRSSLGVSARQAA
jgi:hypothetical protein